jgi:hypothetical protein
MGSLVNIGLEKAVKTRSLCRFNYYSHVFQGRLNKTTKNERQFSQSVGWYLDLDLHYPPPPKKRYATATYWMVRSGPRNLIKYASQIRKLQANVEENNAVHFSYFALDSEELLFGKPLNFGLNSFKCRVFWVIMDLKQIKWTHTPNLNQVSVWKGVGR